MQIHIYNPYSNVTVTKEYIATIESAFRAAEYDAEYVKELKKQDRTSDAEALVIVAKDAITAKRMGYKKVYLWVQGIIPEESYMRRASKVRYWALSAIERMGLRCADFVFYVSHAMQEHFKEKYGYENKNCYIMPCFNAELDQTSFMTEEKYTKNVFLYAGGLDAWQCFEETVALYKKLETQIPNASLRVLTRNREKAERVLKQYGVNSYSIDFKPSHEMKNEMSKVKFGFSLRQEHPVNRVATPTKLSTYVSNGVIPIFSKHISDFHALAKDMRYAICVNDGEDNNMAKIQKLCNDLDAQEIFAEFGKVFGEYYSKTYHISQITKIISGDGKKDDSET